MPTKANGCRQRDYEYERLGTLSLLAGIDLLTGEAIPYIKGMKNCPCGSGRQYSECCGVYISGKAKAPTAEALMRSRYTAYALHDIDYALKTLNGINASLISLLYGLNNNDENQQTFDISENETALFRKWFESQSLEKIGESLTVRCLSLVRHFPSLCGFDFLYRNFFTAFPVYIPIMPDITVPEFVHLIRKALSFFNAEYEYNTLYEISGAVFETMPDCRKFLYEYPLAISNAPGEALLSRQWASLAYRSFFDIKNTHSVKRYIDVLDYTLPNSIGIPAVLFTDKELVLPFIRREYLCFTGIDNEAELRLRSVQDTVQDKYTPPKFVRTQSPNKAKDHVSTFMEFLELYAQGDDTITSPQGHSITRDDIAMMIERYFILSEITPKNLIHAKIMLWYVEPIHSIFRISEASEETLSKINEYIESIYGKPLTIEAAKEKALEYIAQENEHIAVLNQELDFDTENQWKPLLEGSSQWNRLYSILLRQYTRRNTLTLWELKGILYDMQEPRPKPFYFPVTAAIGKFIQKTISKALRSYEKEHPNFIKARKWLYDYFYRKLDKAEKSLDACGWKEYNGECLRRDRNCCTIPLPSPCLTPTGCNSNALACKIWLCSAARSRLVTTRQGRRFLEKRRLYNYLCQAFNIPLKIRCSKLNSFDDKAREPFVDVSMPDWFDKALVGK